MHHFYFVCPFFGATEGFCGWQRGVPRRNVRRETVVPRSDAEGEVWWIRCFWEKGEDKNGFSATRIYDILGGGFKHFLFLPLFGEIIPFWLIFFKGVETTNQLYLYEVKHISLCTTNVKMKEHIILYGSLRTNHSSKECHKGFVANNPILESTKKQGTTTAHYGWCPCGAKHNFFSFNFFSSSQNSQNSPDSKPFFSNVFWRMFEAFCGADIFLRSFFETCSDWRSCHGATLRRLLGGGFKDCFFVFSPFI